ncbi:MAG: hypothetical protein JXR40_04580 [Pontiellaceae bacterium]|nr:hypothetical protein [Pontiellaceae bacterium]
MGSYMSFNKDEITGLNPVLNKTEGMVNMRQKIISGIVVLSFLFSCNSMGYSGGDGTESDPYLINSLSDLQQITLDTKDYSNHDRTLYYKMISDIDLGGLTFTNTVINSGYISFKFDGDGHDIKNMIISAGNDEDYVGFFGSATSANICNLCVIDAEITVGDLCSHVGVLSGYIQGEVSNCYVTGTINTGKRVTNVGGFCGILYGSCSQCYSDVSIVHQDCCSVIGGFSGLIAPYTNSVLIEDCFSSGCISGGDLSSAIGGFAGELFDARGYNYTPELTLLNCYSSGPISEGAHSEFIGGFTGYQMAKTSKCYSNSSILSGFFLSNIGGFCGRQHIDSSIIDSYAEGTITAGSNSYLVAGFVARNDADISNCYTKSSVDVQDTALHVAGFCAQNSGNISNSFWDKLVSGLTHSDGGTGKTTSEMTIQSTFSGWDFSAAWVMDDYPKLTALFSTSKQTFSEWTDEYNLLPQESSYDATPANDGIPNLLKYACGLNPSLAYNSSALLSCTMKPTSEVFTMTYYKSKSSTGVSLEPSKTYSLTNNWTKLGIDKMKTGEDESREIWEASMEVNSDVGFMRLEASMEE